MALWKIQGFLLVFLFSGCCNGEVLEDGCVDIRTIKGPYVAPKVILVRGRGFLYSPGFKENKTYPDNVQCSYQLQAGRAQHVRIHFNTLDIDATEGCGADSLSIHDFDSSGRGRLVSMHCGDQMPYDYVSDSFALQIVLRTDGFAARRGFNISYSVQSTGKVCSLYEKQCRNRNCVDYDVLCDGHDDCGDGTDEENCIGNVPPSTECGKPEFDPITYADFDRVVGGKEAVHGSWPWMADLQMKLIEPNGHTCGGALINSQWVLSAAHCFLDPMMRRPSGWRIHIGNYHKFKKDSSEQIRYPERIIIYGISSSEFEETGKFDIVNDMALIKLNAPVTFSKYVKPICLPDPELKLGTGSNCYATGWGATRGSGGSHVLKQAYHPIQPDVLCKRLVGNQFVPRTMICAGSMGPLNGVCHGDSGGPLVCETSRGQWSIVGVASYVTDTNTIEGLCGLQGRPSGFSRVSIKNSWIRQTINRYS